MLDLSGADSILRFHIIVSEALGFCHDTKMTPAVPDVYTNESRGNMMVPSGGPSSRRKNDVTSLQTPWVSWAHIRLRAYPSMPPVAADGMCWRLKPSGETTPTSRREVQPAQATCVIIGQQFRVLVYRRNENVCRLARNTCPFYSPFLFLPGQVFNQMHLGACYAKI